MPSVKQQLNDLAKRAKYLPDNAKEIMRDFYRLCVKLSQDVARLEDQIRSLRQTDILKPSSYTEGDHVSRSFRTAESHPTVRPLHDEMIEFLEDQETSTEVLERFLRYRGFDTRESALRYFRDLKEKYVSKPGSS